MQIQAFAQVKASGSTAAQYVYLPLPSGRLKQVSMVNLTTFYQNGLIVLVPKGLIPDAMIGTAAIDGRFIIGTGVMGGTLMPIIKQFDLDLDGNRWALGCKFDSTVAGDILEMKAEVETP